MRAIVGQAPIRRSLAIGWAAAIALSGAVLATGERHARAAVTGYTITANVPPSLW